jgi:aspartate aminotransferase
MQTLQSQSTSNPSSISQAAAVAALRGGIDFMDDWLRILEVGRKLVLQSVERCAGLHCAPSDGAFYAFVNCEGVIGAMTPDGTTIGSDLDFATYLLETAHVGVVHGAAFGVDNHIRIAYAVDHATLREACTRIERACSVLVLALQTEASSR